MVEEYEEEENEEDGGDDDDKEEDDEAEEQLYFSFVVARLHADPHQHTHPVWAIEPTCLDSTIPKVDWEVENLTTVTVVEAFSLLVPSSQALDPHSCMPRRRAQDNKKIEEVVSVNTMSARQKVREEKVRQNLGSRRQSWRRSRRIRVRPRREEEEREEGEVTGLWLEEAGEARRQRDIRREEGDDQEEAWLEVPPREKTARTALEGASVQPVAKRSAAREAVDDRSTREEFWS
ncbi:troponin T, cardiac muscle-like [Phalaenopsis equestris]|uniref:troponin T, cardiac muscle-like n=1 Tax=Phalaenopsis equestris TaxID=78828 RepID=UPI0009E5DF91|nr:troponin T, cardiac muscle-like [Phalaenopsis equestris]